MSSPRFGWQITSDDKNFDHFFQSIKGYGIYWDNYFPTNLNDNETLELESQVGEAVDYYFMYGGDADGVIAEMRHLTGHVPMVPLWTYGFHQSRERYKSQNELLEVVDKYRELGIPFDGIIQDWQYGGSNYNYLDGKFSNIKMCWNDKKQTLSIDSRRGSYDGMPLQRTFKVVLPDGRSREQSYTGRRLTVKL